MKLSKTYYEAVMYRKGFTLAEVLITLGIIGVVAAITIPSLITNYQKTVTVNQLKKTYSLLNQALRHSIADELGDPTWQEPNTKGYGTGDPGLKYLIPYLEVAYKFRKGEYVYPIYKANGTSGYSQFLYACSDTSPYAYVLKNGTIIYFVNFLNYFPMGNALFILVDLNGKKGPNRLGRDVFVFTLTKKKPDIIGTYGDNLTVEQLLASGEACPAKGVVSGYQGYNGWGCSTLIIKDG